MSAVKDYYLSSHATVQGNVTFSTGCVVLARARIVAADGVELHFGNYCVVEEYADICVSSCNELGKEGEVRAASVGPYNRFSTRCSVKDFNAVGKGNVFHSFSCICGVLSIGDFNVFAPFVSVHPDPTRDNAEQPLSRRTIVVSPSSLKQSKSPFMVVPRYGSRSVAELPSMAQSLLVASIGVGGPGELAVVVEASDLSDSDEESKPVRGTNGGGGRSPKVSSPSSSSSASHSGSGSTGVIPPEGQQATAHRSDRPAQPAQGQQGHSLSPEDVHTMLAVLPERTEKAVVQDAIKQCRYYLTLYAVL